MTPSPHDPHDRGRRRAAAPSALVVPLLWGIVGCGNPGWWAGPPVARSLPLDLARAEVVAEVPPAAAAITSDGSEYLALLDEPHPDPSRRQALAELLYSAGTVVERQGSCRCVDLFYGAALLAWQSLVESRTDCPRDTGNRAEGLYHSSLARLLECSQKFRRFDADQGLVIQRATGWQRIPIVVHSAVWRQCDVGPIVVVGEYDDPLLSTRFRQPGCGVPVVCQRRPGSGNWLVPDLQPFALTALLRSSDEATTAPANHGETPDAEMAGASAAPAVLELYDSLRCTEAEVAGSAWPLATDITAPLVQGHRLASYNPLREFVKADEECRLTAVGPHQHGRIPVIFVHGLLSDPLTYLDMANELRGDPVLGRRFEVWAFRYPTGGAVLESAATLRQRVTAAVAMCGADDPALSQIVIIGHSMGGLLAKLQVTYSDDTLWSQLAERPFHELRVPDEMRRRLVEVLFFRPSADITRIIYIATPHVGSPWANRGLGRIASLSTQGVPETDSAFREMLDANPDVFRVSAPRRLPSSIDLLEPESPELASLRRLRYGPQVTIHSIIGDSRNLLGAGPSDGVVPVTSAHEPAAVSEVHVPAGHTTILRAPESFAEVKRILHEHLRQVPPEPGPLESRRRQHSPPTPGVATPRH